MKKEVNQVNNDGDNIAGDTVTINKQIMEIIQPMFDKQDIKFTRELNRLRKRVVVRKWHYILMLIIIVILSVLFFGFAVWLNKKCDLKLSSSSIVIAFVGMLATFVVISNYVQVVEVKNEFGEKLSAAENLGDEIKTLEKEVTTLDGKLKEANYSHNFNLFLMYCSMNNYNMALPIGLVILLETQQDKINDMVGQMILLLKGKKIMVLEQIKSVCLLEMTKLKDKFTKLDASELYDIINNAETVEVNG